MYCKKEENLSNDRSYGFSKGHGQSTPQRYINLDRKHRIWQMYTMVLIFYVNNTENQHYYINI